MADVILNITIPDAYVAKVIDAFTKVAGMEMRIEAQKHTPDISERFNGHWQFTISPKGTSESLKDFGERCFRELGKAIINMVDKAEDEQRYRNEISAIIPPESDVPEDILI